MIGIPVELAIWRVSYRYRNPELEEKPDAQPWAGANDVEFSTADPSGADLFDVVRLVIERAIGKPPELFAIIGVTRIATGVRGLANHVRQND